MAWPKISIFLLFVMHKVADGVDFQMSILIDGDPGPSDQIDLTIQYEYKHLKIPDNPYLDPKDTNKIELSAIPLRHLVVDLGAEALRANRLQFLFRWKCCEVATIGPDNPPECVTRTINANIYSPNFERIYEFRLGAPARLIPSKSPKNPQNPLFFDGQFYFNENDGTYNDDVFVLFLYTVIEQDFVVEVDQDDPQQNAKIMTTKWTLTPLGCRMIEQDKLIRGTTRWYRYEFPFALDKFYGQRISGLRSFMYRIKSYTKGQNNDESEDECPICLERFAVNEKALQMQTMHNFHMKCLKTWLDKSGDIRCPKCNSYPEPIMVAKIEPLFTTARLYLDSMAELNRIAHKEGQYFSKNQAKWALERIQEELKPIEKRIRWILDALKITKFHSNEVLNVTNEFIAEIREKSAEIQEETRAEMLKKLAELNELVKSKSDTEFQESITENVKNLHQKSTKAVKIHPENAETSTNSKVGSNSAETQKNMEENGRKSSEKSNNSRQNTAINIETSARILRSKILRTSELLELFSKWKEINESIAQETLEMLRIVKER